ncbi:hypothetical protein B566_EDAN017074 [Ephemera danica]|nr:hypothetical protein B566_EDAN017074 [Ephemera danica]
MKCLPKMLLLLLLVSVTSGAEIIPRASYTAAVVEFAPKGSPSDPASLIYSVNLQDFENFTQDVKTQGADIIVFPEYGLTGTECSSDRTLALDFSQIVPDPEENLNPCDTYGSSMEYETIRRLSCMARDSSIIIVVNLIERVPCQNCARDDVLLFGLMTCFDIMFVSPAVTVQTQAAWSFSLDVNLLASGYSRPHLSSTGSGIYGGLRHGALKTLMAEVKTNEALVATLPPVESPTPRRLVTHKDDLSAYTSVKLEATNNSITVQNCHGAFCCYLSYSVLNSTPDFNYQFLAYDGFRTHADDMYPSKLQVCALIACAFENHTSCAEEIKYSTYSLETEFAYVELHGIFKSQRVWPNTLYADTLNPIQPQDFSYSTGKYGNDYMIRLNSSSVKNGLHTFALYSHDYEPYNPNSSNML